MRKTGGEIFGDSPPLKARSAQGSRHRDRGDNLYRPSSGADRRNRGRGRCPVPARSRSVRRRRYGLPPCTPRRRRRDRALPPPPLDPRAAEVKTTSRGTLRPPREVPTTYLGRCPMPTSRAAENIPGLSPVTCNHRRV